MSESPDDDLTLSPAAAALAELLARREAGERIDFDVFCAQHPAIEVDLRRLHGRLGAAARALASQATRSPEPLPPSIGAHRVETRLGEGGMGTVYRCLSPDGQHVAVKVVRRGLDSARTLARFELERQTLSAFAHPNIAAVREAGTTSDGRPYFAMEYVDGSPITRYASAHDLDVAACARLVAAVCDGVQHAHERGVLHRDLKPSNVLVTAGADGLPVPKIIDFGLARAVDAAAASRPFLTTRGVVLGTPEYMSPEQAAAGAEAVDVRSDVYAIGLMLYETCARAHPYIDLPNLGPVELLRRIVEATPVAPSVRACDPERAAALRPHLDAVILRAIDKLPAERYASAADLARDLRA